LHTEESKDKMRKSKIGAKNPLYAKTHSESTKDLMSKAKLGKNQSDSTKDLISMKKGNTVYLYEKPQIML